MKKLKLLLLFVFGAWNLYSQNQQINIPKGKAILIDGKIHKKEWDDSKVVCVSDSLTIYLKTDKEYVYFAIQVSEGKSIIADMYFTSGNNVINLHSSAKLGQRNFKNEIWENWNWWNNILWSANVSRVDSFEKITFLKEDVREFQIHKNIFTTNLSKSFFEVTFLNEGGKNSILSYPAMGIRDRTDNWLTLEWK